MKMWFGYGSEHSANLVMIGHFKDAQTAERAEKVIAEIRQKVENDSRDGQMEIGELSGRYTDGMLELLGNLKVHSVGPAELEQFSYDVPVKRDGDKLVSRTDEVELSAFIKVMIDYGARIEIYSAHEHPDATSDGNTQEEI
jgi:hypothetical protein